jgi:hypothetical protein
MYRPAIRYGASPAGRLPAHRSWARKCSATGEREALVRQALRDVDVGDPDDPSEQADVEYHRGVLPAREGRGRSLGTQVAPQL